MTVAQAPAYQEKNTVVAKLYNIWMLLGQPVVLSGGHLAPELPHVPGVVGSNASMRVLDVSAFQGTTIVFPGNPRIIGGEVVRPSQAVRAGVERVVEGSNNE